MRYALRQLVKNPMFTALAVTTLALGIGAAAAMFGLHSGRAAVAAPIRDPGRLVLVSPARIDGQPVPPWRDDRAMADVARRRRTLSRRRSTGWTFNFLVLPDGSQSLGGMVVTPDYFRVLGLRPILGREFTDAELGRPKCRHRPSSSATTSGSASSTAIRTSSARTIRISRHAGPAAGGRRDASRASASSRTRARRASRTTTSTRWWTSGSASRRTSRARATPPERHCAAAGRRDAAQAQRRDRDAESRRLAQSDPALSAGITADGQRRCEDVLNREGRRLLVPLFGSGRTRLFHRLLRTSPACFSRAGCSGSGYAMRSALGAGRWRLVPADADREPRSGDCRRGARRRPRGRHRDAC